MKRKQASMRIPTFIILVQYPTADADHTAQGGTRYIFIFCNFIWETRVAQQTHKGNNDLSSPAIDLEILFDFIVFQAPFALAFSSGRPGIDRNNNLRPANIRVLALALALFDQRRKPANCWLRPQWFYLSTGFMGGQRCLGTEGGISSMRSSGSRQISHLSRVRGTASILPLSPMSCRL